MAKVILASQSSRDSSNVAANPERLINMIAERMNQGSKTTMTLRSVPGQISFADTETVLLRDMKTVNGVLYVAAAGNLFSVGSSGAVTLLGSITDDENTIIDGNGASVTISAGGNYYVWDGTTLSQPAGGLLTSIGSVGFSGQYTILTELGGNRFEWTALADPETRDGLNFATCESNNDDVIRVIPHMNYIWLFNQESTEIWYNTGAAGANAFAPLAGGTSDIGIKSAKLAVRFDGGIFFVGNDGVTYLSSGAGLSPISTPAVETATAEKTPTHCYYYEYRGHKICVIRFSDRPAWCYDFTTSLWHERSSGVEHNEWESIGVVFAYSKWLSATNIGKIYEMKGNTDVSAPLRRTIVSRSFYSAGNRFTAAEFEVLGRFGEQEITTGGVIREPIIMARFSKDGGRTWSGEKTRGIGKVGERFKRPIWRGLGQFRDFVAEVSMTDDVDVSLYSEAILVVK